MTTEASVELVTCVVAEMWLTSGWLCDRSDARRNASYLLLRSSEVHQPPLDAMAHDDTKQGPPEEEVAAF